MQSPYKNWVLIAFAKRVSDGSAKQYEVDFMQRFMLEDIPEKDISTDAADVFNLIGLCLGIYQEDCDSLKGALNTIDDRK